ncbi:benzoate/H(+) symporter BenE family transporter [Granulicoccus sp. GXG6511]|uniref:benzoate/H(+) symporter BenE family transporter n=1 Tax=Granulicoccus sp. GXG6511 TaxID=3381351 RepID=UPI003D7DF685
MTTTPPVAKDEKTPLFERPGVRPASPRDIVRDSGIGYASNGLIGMIFAASGPVAIILGVGAQGGLSSAELASWIFGVFLCGGILTIIASVVYRQPLGFAFTIPGVVLVGPALGHLTWPEVIGAFFVTALLILVLGVTGLVRKVMAAIPMPIVMAMVAGVFLRFGTDLITSVEENAVVAAPMVITFVLLTAIPRLGKFLPPVLGALVVGAIAVALSGQFQLEGGVPTWFAAPVWTAPVWSVGAMLELVVPLAITVLVVQNGQGVAVLQAAGHKPPVNVTAVACGVSSGVAAAFGAVATCLTGPTNALLTASGEKRRQYTAAIAFGILSILFALFAPGFTTLMLAAPPAYILSLGGIAMLRALQQAFVTSFRGAFTLSALITFVVTISGLTIFNIGAAFWGIVIGYIVSRLMERDDYRKGLAG